MSVNFFFISFAGDTGDTGDMKNLKIYTNVQVKPKSVDWQTRQFDSKGVPLFLDFLPVTSAGLLTRQFDSKGVPLFLDFFAGDTDDIRKMNECPIFSSVFCW